MRKSIAFITLFVLTSLQSEVSLAQTIEFQKSDRLEKEILRREEQNKKATSWGENVVWPISRSEGIEILCAYSGLIYVEIGFSGLFVHAADMMGRMDLDLFYTWDTDQDIALETNRLCDSNLPINKVEGQPLTVRCTPNPLLCEPGF